MKVCDLIFRYPTGRHLRHDGLCRLRLFVTSSQQVVALVSEIDGNPGNSITNCAERLHAALVAAGFVTENALMIEHHEADRQRDDEYAIVTFPGGNADWTPITRDEFAMIADFPDIDREPRFDDDPRLLHEFGRLLTEVNPHWELPYPEPPDVIARRQMILVNAVQKSDILAAIASRKGECHFRDLLKRDLSLLGEVYADQTDEYIVFTELPVGDGFVDFALFTGRSRMDVFLIEIKGADFRLVNRSSYGNIAAKANEAAQQVRERMGVAARDEGAFRQYVHELRNKAETRRPIHGSLLGPCTPLEVDPHKDIWIRGVVIAGHTVNDKTESHIRHNFEYNSHHISLDSWDTWARRLTRR